MRKKELAQGYPSILNVDQKNTFLLQVGATIVFCSSTFCTSPICAETAKTSASAQKQQAPNMVHSDRPQRKDEQESRMLETPDLMQASPSAALPWGGQAHCGPVAASNTLIWFAKKGFDGIVEGDPQTTGTQAKLALKLGSYMRTSLTEGTTVTAFLCGLNDYLTDKGFQETLLYQGWEQHPQQYDAGGHAQLQFLREGLKSGSAAWIKIGWYKFYPRTNTFMRFAGHWVTLVDAGSDRNGAANPNCVVIHDPAPRSGASTASEYATITVIKTGKLATGYSKPSTAAGMLRMGGELKIKDKADCGIIDGVILLKNLQTI